MTSRPGRTRRGFTLIELLVVMAALGLLLSIIAPRYVQQVDRTREVVLRHNLTSIREAIDQYRADRGRYPAALAELVEARYLRDVPIDPMTDRADSWVLVAPSTATQGAAVVDVRSAAPGQGASGTPYAAW